jgi:uncharacterized membrane protein
MWSERTRLGKELSGALVATLAGMALANLGYLPAHAPEVNHVFKFLLPLAIPMLLYSANLVKILSSTGRLLAAFLLGSACTVVGSILAMAIFPLTPLGEEGWKIAAALTARHIGGAGEGAWLTARNSSNFYCVLPLMPSTRIVCVSASPALYCLCL